MTDREQPHDGVRDHSSPREEIRLALVLNGGISLAVWMAGVTYELDQCRTATAGTTTASRTAWADLLATANRSVAIDMIAGASAGGLNGVILGSAIAREAELTGLKDLWMGLAALQADKLLAKVPRPRLQLLDGDFFQREVAKLLAGTTKQPPLPPNVGGRADCVLLVTATALAQAGVDDLDSRRVYRFRRRDGIAGTTAAPEVEDTDDFAEVGENAAGLTLAARATASFPAAFRPVVESPALHQRLRPRRPGSPKAPGGSWLMDGGVLDNAPFEPMLDELIDRPVSGAFARHLVYVNPSAGSAPTSRASTPGPTVGSAGDTPTLLATVSATLAALRQTDRRMDGERLFDAKQSAALRSVQPDGVLRSLLLDATPAGMSTAELSSAAVAAFGQYRLSRAASYCVQHGLEPVPIPAAPFLPVAPPSQSVTDPEWSWGLSAAERILRWWGRILGQLPETADRTAAYRELYRAQLTVSAWEHQRAALIAALESGLDQGREVALDILLVGEDAFYTPSRRTQIAELVQSAATATAAAIDAVRGAGPTPTQLITTSLELDVFTSATIAKVDRNAETPRFVTWTIDPSAPPPFAFEAQDEPSWSQQKLCGERWKAFGAFGSEDGRRWDYLWGRLDAATTLAEHLLAGVDPEVARRCTNEVIAAILAEEGTDEQTVAVTAKAMTTLTNVGLLALYARSLITLPGAGKPPSEQPDSQAAAVALLRGVPSIFGGTRRVPGPVRTLVGFGVARVAGRVVRKLAKGARDPWTPEESA